MKMIWIASLGLAVPLAACGKKDSGDDRNLGLSMPLLAQKQPDAGAQQALAVQMEAQAALRDSGLSAVNSSIKGRVPLFSQACDYLASTTCRMRSHEVTRPVTGVTSVRLRSEGKPDWLKARFTASLHQTLPSCKQPWKHRGGH